MSKGKDVIKATNNKYMGGQFNGVEVARKLKTGRK